MFGGQSCEYDFAKEKQQMMIRDNCALIATGKFLFMFVSPGISTIEV